MRLAKRLAFLHLDNFFGVTRGEQPLVRASRASKVAGAFLVLFWHAKENLAPRNRALTPRHKRAQHPFIRKLNPAQPRSTLLLYTKISTFL